MEENNNDNRKEELETVMAERKKFVQSYVFKPGFIGAIIALIVWIVAASFQSAFSGAAGSAEWVIVIHNVSKTISSISCALFWVLFLPALIIGIIFMSINSKKIK